MPAKDAEYLENWIPDSAAVRARPGSRYETTSSLSTAAQTNLEYRAAMRSHLVTAGGNRIHTVSPNGTVTQHANGYISDKWQGINFSGRMFLFNGVDSPQTLTETVSGSDFGTSIEQSGWTGVTTSNLIDAHVFKNRVLFVEKDSADFLYADVDAIQGTLTRFPLSRVARQGGKLLSIKSWSVDGGEGPDDYAVFIMDTGEVIVYQGNDPGRSAAWGLVGRYKIPKPVHRRAIAEIGGEILVATEQDYVTLPSYFAAVARTGQPPVTKLCGAIQTAARTYGSLPHWQVFWDKANGWVICNIPTGQQSSEQHVFNLKTGAPTKFAGWNTAQFAAWKDKLYFSPITQSLAGAVIQAGVGTRDNFDSTPTYTNVTTVCYQAPTAFDYAGPKAVVDYRPLMASEGDLTITTGLAYDFGQLDFSQTVTVQSNGTPWNTSDWDTVSWTSEDFTKTEWLSGGGDGTYVQHRMIAVAPLQNLVWRNTQFRYRPVGPNE